MVVVTEPELRDTDFGISVFCVKRDCAIIHGINCEPERRGHALDCQCFCLGEQSVSDAFASEVFLYIQCGQLNFGNRRLWTPRSDIDTRVADKVFAHFGNNVARNRGATPQ